jgi:hypothetical protein
MYPSAGEIAAMQDTIAHLFTDRCNIVREVKAADQYGGESEVPQPIAEGVPCEVYPQVQALRPLEVVAGQVEVRMLWNVAMPVGTDVRVGDKLTILSNNQETVVQSVLDPETLDLEMRVVVSLQGEPYV